METVSLLDRALSGRSLVFGSLPPHGRDLDLLVPADQLEVVEATLAGAGFQRAVSVWASFKRCPPEVVEVVTATSWGLPPAELRSLFADALPLPWRERLVRPAPHHVLLVLARRVARSGRLEDRLRSRMAAAIDEDPRAVAGARERAGAWGCTGSLALLERAYEEGHAPPVARRALAIVSELRARGRRPAGIVAGVVAATVGRPRLGAVVALSGLDGSGKSTQARLLSESLQRLGYETALRWPAIDAPSRSISTLTRLGKGAAGALSGSAGDDRDGGHADPARALRERSELITHAWSGVYALRGAVRVARMTWPQLLRGRIVVCDRYLLDSNVFFLHRYGEGRRYRVQLALLRLLAPRPRASFLIEVPAAVAAARQPERTAAENAERGRLYRILAQAEAIEIVDGERPTDEVCATIGEHAWRALSRGAAG